MGGRWPFTEEKIASRLALIAPYIFRRKRPLPPFRLMPLTGAMIDAPVCADPTNWEEVPHESYWGQTDLNFVLKSSFRVPQDWNAKHLALHLPLGELGDIFNHPEALVHIDQVPIGSADRYHHTLPLNATVSDGAEHVLSLHGWTGLAGWPPDPASKAKLFMGTPSLVERDEGLLAFHQLASAALDTVSVLEPEREERHSLLAALDHAFKVLDTRDPIGDDLYNSVAAAHAALDSGIAAAGQPLDVTLHGIGHAHMDIAYLWPISQIRLKNARTYSNVLRLMEEEPNFKFSHSQPQLYAMTANDYPALFEQIKARVAEGRWEVMGGMWVEPDLNIPGPEALVRQLTLGRQYFRDTFGDVETPVLWLPDTFGFPAQIPQLMRLAGLKWFVTNKLNWNQKNKVPSSTHHWEGLDGSRVLAHILTTPRDVQYLPFPTNYKSDLSAAEVLGTSNDPTIPGQINTLPICYGYGDGGGGPTEDLLAKARAYGNMPGMPKLKMSTVRETFEHIEASAANLPLWPGEHYMEGHRGVLTSQGWIKRANRRAEQALHEAEALSAMAGSTPDLSEAWRLLCLNQFHDIVTGTSVPSVFKDARRDFAKIMEIAERAAAQAATALRASSPAIANTSPISGTRVILQDGSASEAGQAVEDGTLLFFEMLPAYSVTPTSNAILPAKPVCIEQNDASVALENAYLRVEIAPNGQLTRVFDKTTGCDFLKSGCTGNQLQTFEDRPICWDAWDIDPHFEDRMEIFSGATTFEIMEHGPIRASVRVTTRWRSSVITQKITLCAHSNRIDFVTDVDWHEQHTLLKAAFPTAVQAPYAQFDIQWGHVERATSRESSFDAARFEVPAQKWAMLTTPELSVAVLNDCKYGYDVHDDTIRITLIKSSTAPDPNADQGPHTFTYSLLPITGNDRHSLDREAYDLNSNARFLPADSGASDAHSLFRSIEPRNVIVETLKPAEDGNGIVLRVFEAAGQEAVASITFVPQILTASTVDFWEQDVSPISHDEHRAEVRLHPFEIVTLRVVLSP
ncbi:glycoside hydrolase family 38 C-terminal domain-containing protein [uncultured Tateyamaria sp.]|uniref:alpha-mannosidase n=1 Tax=uncultured Tateyamaria sp. TaxID=455651 RepID=UPI00262AFBCE|nr:glycoside hydrolase family 38 C-terminal domain-containing protein [uncultured Tateyamaria sp.]